MTVEDFAGGLESLEFAEGAIEGAFVLAAVTGEAIELTGDVFVGEGALGEGIGFQDLDAAEVPASGDELFKEGVFEGVLRIDLFMVLGLELGEGGLLIVANEETSGEVMAVGIEADGGFAFGRAGSGGVLGVFAVGGLTGSG